ncbi:tetratricopeptide repeat protein 5-like [Neltuma alba]|uniref:tetratricopeptide repeat protein 5-like n=1 Tax=Neltuma alba TaxID=207710 RepID=UPI0010A4A790|nr:tetratricopeptide repeat protein 5-like [Prosopis alba]
MSNTPDSLASAYEVAADLYLTRANYGENEDDKISKLQEQSDVALKILDSLPPEERKLPLEQATFKYLRGKILDMCPHYSKEAEDHLFHSVKLSPPVADAWLCLSNCFYERGDLPAAKDCLCVALSKGPDKKILCQLSMLTRKMSEGAKNEAELLEESIRHAKEAIALDVKDGHSWYNLGNACFTSFLVSGARDDSKLLDSLKAYLNADKDETMKSNPHLSFNNAKLFRYLEDYEGAISAFEAVISKNPALNAATEVQNIVNLLDKLDNLMRIYMQRGHLRSKGKARLASSLASVRCKLPFELSTLDLLLNGLNRAVAVDGRVLSFVMNDVDVPLYYLLRDSNQTCFVLTVYGVRKDVIKEADWLTLLDPKFRHVDFSCKGKCYQFKSIRVDFPEQVLVNGKAVTPQQAVHSSTYARHICTS